MARIAYNWSRILQLLGAKDQGDTSLELVEALQPVVVGIEATGVVPPLRGTQGLAGGNSGSTTAARTIVAQVQSLDPGGCWVRRFGCDSSVHLGVFSTPHNFVTTVSTNVSSWGPFPFRSKFTLGSVNNGDRKTANSTHFALSNVVEQEHLNIWLPRGRVFVAEINTAALGGSFSLLLEGVPERSRPDL